MNNATFYPLAAALVLGLAPALSAQTPPAKPLTESELLKTLDGLGKGDPVTKQPLSIESQPRTELPSKSDEPKPEGARGPAGKTGKNDAAAPEQKQTEITSEEGTFDSKTHKAVFTINVFVKNPDFTVSCDKMTAFMKHDDKPDAKGAKGAKATPAPRATPTPGPTRLAPPTLETDNNPTVKTTKTPDASKDQAGGLERAIAEGNVIITQDKLDEDGKVTHNVGRGKKAVYESSTGDITLTGKPDVQQGINTCVSLDEKTIIIMNRDGHFHSIGPTKNIIREATSTPAPGEKSSARATPRP